MQRLKTRAQFQAVLSGGSVCSRTAHFALHCLLDSSEQESTEQSIGALLPKRWASRSVTRHLMRRLVYAVSHNCASELPRRAAYVVRLRWSFARKDYPSASSEQLRRALRTELEHLFSKVRKVPKAQ